jgi:CheY-like chemotaxis protein
MINDDEDQWMLVEQAFAEEASRYDFEVGLHNLEDGVDLLDYLDHCRGGEAPLGPTPDFILLDLNMPAMGGRETLQKVISHSICRRIPIIVLTTSTDQTDIIECYRCGGNAFSRKPHDSKTLTKMVRIIVNHWLCAAQQPGSSPFNCMGYG